MGTDSDGEEDSASDATKLNITSTVNKFYPNRTSLLLVTTISTNRALLPLHHAHWIKDTVCDHLR